MSSGAGVGTRRGPLVGAVISGVAGALWAIWGASGLSVGAVTARVAGIVLGVAVVVAAVVIRRRSPGGDGPSMFAARGYRLTVLAEVVAIVAGAGLLGAAGQGVYVVAWTAFVVGVHFLVFGRLFATRFSWLGGALVIAALAGVVVGLAGTGGGAIRAVTGLLCAIVLLGTGASTVVSAARAT